LEEKLPDYPAANILIINNLLIAKDPFFVSWN